MSASQPLSTRAPSRFLSSDGGPARAGQKAALAAASLGFAIVQLDVSVVNVAVRSIGADLGAASAACSGWWTRTRWRSPP
jgi:hypothetical protein